MMRWTGRVKPPGGGTQAGGNNVAAVLLLVQCSIISVSQSCG